MQSPQGNSQSVRRLLVVAGEASADGIAAGILGQLKTHFQGLEFFGVGGEKLRQLGMDVVVRSDQVNLVGLSEWLDRWLEISAHFIRVENLIESHRPEAALLIDLPDFNLMLAGQLKRAGIPVIYCNPPQVWAWRQYRVWKIRRRTDRLLVQFPFEREFYQKHGLDAVYTGHPLCTKMPWRETLRSQGDILASPRLALLPGSRHSELRHHGPVLGQLASELAARFPRVQFKLPLASTLQENEVRAALGTTLIEIVRSPAQEVFAWADAAAVCSGTATLEAALTGVPLCVFYRMDASSHFMGRHIFRYRGALGLPNVLAGKTIVPEFIQNQMTAEQVGNCLAQLLTDATVREQMRRELLSCRNLLRVEASPEQVAARAVIETLNAR